jgi:hypothetical protein
VILVAVDTDGDDQSELPCHRPERGGTYDGDGRCRDRGARVVDPAMVGHVRAVEVMEDVGLNGRRPDEPPRRVPVPILQPVEKAKQEVGYSDACDDLCGDDDYVHGAPFLFSVPSRSLIVLPFRAIGFAVLRWKSIAGKRWRDEVHLYPSC